MAPAAAKSTEVRGGCADPWFPRWRKLLVFLAVQAAAVASGKKAADVRSLCKGCRGPQARGGGSPLQSPPGAPTRGHSVVTVLFSSSRQSLGGVRRRGSLRQSPGRLGRLLALLCPARTHSGLRVTPAARPSPPGGWDEADTLERSSRPCYAVLLTEPDLLQNLTWVRALVSKEPDNTPRVVGYHAQQD